MKTASDISVVIPAYNAHDTIAATIDSVIAQTLQCREIIVVDDGGAQPIAPVLARFGPIVRCVRQENLGAAGARNRGIEQSRGELIAFLDADDLWDPKKLERQREILEAHPQLALVATRFFLQAPGSSERELSDCEPALLDRVLPPPVGQRTFELASRIWTSTVIVRRSALGDERFVGALQPAEDQDLWLRLVRKHPSYICSAALATAILTAGSLSRSDPDSGYGPMINVLHRHADLVSPREMRSLEANVYRAWAGAHLAERHPRRALPKALERLQRQPTSLEAWWIVSKSAMLSLALSSHEGAGFGVQASDLRSDLNPEP